MRFLKTFVFIVSVMIAGSSFAQTEPNYYDLPMTVESLKSLKNSCPQTNPGCVSVCSEGIERAILMDTGGNITSQEASILKGFWWSCYNILMQ